MKNTRKPQQALKYKSTGTRDSGRPMIRWRDQIHLQRQEQAKQPKPAELYKKKNLYFKLEYHKLGVLNSLQNKNGINDCDHP